MKKSENELTDGPIARTMFLFTLPILGSTVLQSLNGSINMAWIGRFLGERALTASANANAVLFVLIGLMVGAGMATSILIGQALGKRDADQAKRVLGTSITFFAVVSIVLAVAGAFLSPTLLKLMHTPEDALPLATAYLRVVFLGTPSLYLTLLVAMALRGAGDAKTPFVFMLVSVVLDVGLNPLLIFGWGPIPGFGIAGSAAASLLAQSGSFILLVAYLYRTKNALRIERHELRYLLIDTTVLRELVTKGVPMGLQMLVVSLSLIAAMSLVNAYGSHTTAAYSAALALWNYIQMPAVAVGQAVTSMAAQNVGAGKWGRVDRVAITGVAFNFLLSGVLVALVYAFDRPALGLFLGQGEAMGIARHLNAIVVWSFIPFGVSFALGGVMRSTGAAMAPLLILFVSLWLVRFPFAYLLTPQLQADAIWWSFPVGSVVSLVLSSLYYKHGGWRSHPSSLQSRQHDDILTDELAHM